jgi:drug/metabolite transporter (DMT)-like permease
MSDIQVPTVALKSISQERLSLGLSPAWQGAYWKIASCAAFAGINGIVRYLSGHGMEMTIAPLPTEVMVFFQNIIGSLLLIPILLKTQGLKNITTRYPGLHLIRVLTAVMGVYLWYLSLKFIPLAESVALSFTGPIFTVIGARVLLHEKMNAQRLCAITLSMIGAFIISRPDLALQGEHPIMGLAAFLPLSSALILAWNKLLTRKLGLLGESPELLATYLLLFMAPISFIPACFKWVTPNLQQSYWLMALGLLVAIAHLSFGKAYKLAEVSFLTPFGFSKFMFSTLIGYLAFAELPTQWTIWLGIGIIFISILILSSKKIPYRIPLYSIAKRFRSS